MKLNIEVDLDDFYTEDFQCDSDLGARADNSISQEIVNIVKGEVNRAISAQVGKSVELLAKKALEEFGEEKAKTIVDFKMEQFLQSGMVAKNFNSKEMIPIEDRLREIFDSSSSWQNPYDSMKKIGEGFAKECRSRYDMAFASNIVTGLEKQGLLKPGVFESLTRSEG